MSHRLIILPTAEADIAAIWDYGVREHGVDAANRYVARISHSLELALQFPSMGSDYGEVRKGYRKLASGDHLIFYIPHDGGIDVVRVLHGRMDVEVWLGE